MRKRKVATKNVKWWYFIIESETGRKEHVSPGSTKEYPTKEEAVKATKQYCEKNNYKFIGEC